MNKTDYINKMNIILNDQTTFRKLQVKDSLLTTLKIEDNINYRIRKWKKENIIDPSIADTLTTSGTTPGIMHGLSKIHKEGTPLRPILSATNTSS